MLSFQLNFTFVPMLTWPTTSMMTGWAALTSGLTLTFVLPWKLIDEKTYVPG